MKIINCQTLGELCKHILDGEPVFIIRAKDSLSVERLQNYLDAAVINGAPITGRVIAAIDEFKEWQAANPAKVKLPD